MKPFKITNAQQIQQGDIIKVNFSPTHGHEQAGYRPALVISHLDFHRINGLIMILPISSDNDEFPGHVDLQTVHGHVHGKVLCEHVKTIDPISRTVKVFDQASKKSLQQCKFIHDASTAFQ